MTQPTNKLDQGRVDAFAERLLGVLNDAAIGLSITIGHRTGLFDTMSKMPPATSHDIAAKAKLTERYVREWLGAMVTGRVIEYDSARSTYTLPKEHAASLTRDASPNNIATTTQWISVMASVESRVVECFAKGGGVAYEEFHRFHEVMAEESAQTVVAGLLDHILPLKEDLVGQLERGIEVLDIGCGSGRAIMHMAKAFPASRFTGYEHCMEAVEAARAALASEGLSNCSFECKDIARLYEKDRYELVTAFDVIHDQKDPGGVLSEVHAIIKPGGLFLMQDIAGSSHLEKNMDHPLGPFLYTISMTHCMTVSLAQGGAGLGTMWGEELAVQMLNEAGFAEVAVKSLPHDIINNYYIAPKG